uniref:polypeptide N-acetylgalactosaminyltransferase n=1 Tax=Pundamilia nyererei TaxID=303518 RepID=A0A3B4GWS3_9CICH
MILLTPRDKGVDNSPVREVRLPSVLSPLRPSYNNHQISLTLQLQNDLLKSHCVDQGPVPGNIPILHECHFQQPQHCYYNTDGEIIIGGITSHNYNSDRCLVDPGSGSSPTLQECPLAKTNELHMHWDFKQDLAIINKATNRCLEIAQGANLYYELIIQQCSGQSWRIEHLVTSF